MRKIYFLCRRFAPICLLLGLSHFLSACGTNKPPIDSNSAKEPQDTVQLQSPALKVPESTSEPKRIAPKMVLCQNQLDMLKQVSARQHKQYHQAFNRLMHSTVQYARMRAQVNDNTQETMDALYQFKVNRLCSSISQALLNALVDGVESVK